VIKDQINQNAAITSQVSITPVVTPEELVSEFVQASLTPIDELQVPLPNATDTINLFWQLIDEHRIPDAIAMMSPQLVAVDDAKQSYGVMFNAFQSVKVLKNEPYFTDTWTDNYQLYITTIEVAMDENSANEVIPFYGYNAKTNVRFISLNKSQDNKWQISGIATGP
jgi:hypothetical protein